MYYLGLVLIVSSWNIDSRVEVAPLEVAPHWWDRSYRDTRYVISSPLRWDKGDWCRANLQVCKAKALPYLILVGATGGLMSQDERIQDWAQESRSSTRDKVASIFEPLGAEGAVILLAGGYLGGWATGNAGLEKMALLGVESASISTATVLSLKFLTGRSRPYTGDDARTYSPFNIHASHQSFPSGHTAMAFSVASCIAEECNNTLISVLSYGTAALVGLSRINDNEHWASDVFVGSIIGIAIGRAVVKLNQ